MKWFRHDSTAMYDAKIEKLMMKYGIEGYGVYFGCIELIAHNVNKDNLTFELEHDAEILAHKFKIDTIKLEEIMFYCIQLGLFGQSEINGRITCLKLAKRIDNSTAKNPEFKKIQQDITETVIDNSEKFGKSSKDSSQIRLDKIRLDKNNNKSSKKFKKPKIEEIQEYLQQQNITSFTAEEFYDHYEATGWMKGKNKVKCWKACIRTWKNKNKEKEKKNELTDIEKEYGFYPNHNYSQKELERKLKLLEEYKGQYEWASDKEIAKTNNYIKNLRKA